jgi:hypothetical protein
MPKNRFGLTLERPARMIFMKLSKQNPEFWKKENPLRLKAFDVDTE